MLDIERPPRRVKAIPLVSLIDVVFQLLIYFMLTTSFTRSESLELVLPGAGTPLTTQVPVATAADTLHIYIANTGETFIERDNVGLNDMPEVLQKIFMQNPERGVLVMSANRVSVGSLVKVLDRIYTAGGKNIAVADWATPKTRGGNG